MTYVADKDCQVALKASIKKRKENSFSICVVDNCEQLFQKNVPTIGKCCGTHYARWHKANKTINENFYKPIKRHPDRAKYTIKELKAGCTSPHPFYKNKKCGKKIEARYKCSAHYKDPNYKLTPYKWEWHTLLSDEEKVSFYLDLDNGWVVEEDHGSATPCLIWTGCRTVSKGGSPYGKCAGKKAFHRFVYFTLNPKSEDGVVHHKCHQTLCGNPKHLIVEKNVSDNAYEGHILAKALDKIVLLEKEIDNLRRRLNASSIR